MARYKITLRNGTEEVEAHGFENNDHWTDFYVHTTVHDGKGTIHVKQPVLRVQQSDLVRVDRLDS